MKKKHLFGLSALSGFLLFFSWPVTGFPFLIFIAFVPLLFVEEYIRKNSKKIHKTSIITYSYLTFFIWNVSTTWWIWFASAGGAIMAILTNSLLMALVFGIFHFTAKRVSNKFIYPSFIALWIIFEYIHMQWDITWPWLTLGNVFAEYVSFVQWYEYTGHLGGSLWVLLLNVIAFKIVSYYLTNKRFDKPIIPAIITFITIFVLPSLLSVFMYMRYTEKSDPVNVVVVQPNIDPYNEKFTAMSEEMQLAKALQLASTLTDEKTDYVITPETTLPRDIDERDLESTESIKTLRAFCKPFPKLKILMGISTYRFYEPNEQPSSTSRKSLDGFFYDVYNTAMQLDQSSLIQLYHKSKLVPGVEKMPFPWLFKPLEKFAIDLGGTAGSLGTQTERTVFKSQTDKCAAAPVICYESIYGEFIGEYVKKGANFIAIITNDGWWQNTPGYLQHLNYGRLRAIEHRRRIARSANTGISAIINQRGDILNYTNWWVDDVIKATINKNEDLTFYTRMGDYLPKMAVFFYLFVLIIIAKGKFEKK